MSNLLLWKRDILDTDIVAGRVPPYRPVCLRELGLFRSAHCSVKSMVEVNLEVATLKDTKNRKGNGMGDSEENRISVYVVVRPVLNGLLLRLISRWSSKLPAWTPHSCDIYMANYSAARRFGTNLTMGIM